MQRWTRLQTGTLGLGIRMPKKIAPKVGDIIEIPVDDYLAYAVVLEDCGHRLHSIQAERRPTIREILESQSFAIVTAAAWKADTGEWPIIGNTTLTEDERWKPPFRQLIPGEVDKYTVYDSRTQIVRPCRPEDASLPVGVRCDDERLVNLYRQHWGLPIVPDTSHAETEVPNNTNPHLLETIIEELDFCGDEVQPFLLQQLTELKDQLEDLPAFTAVEKRRLIRDCVVRLNEFDAENELIDSVERDVLCGLFKEIGEAFNVAGIPDWVNRHREW